MPLSRYLFTAFYGFLLSSCSASYVNETDSLNLYRPVDFDSVVEVDSSFSPEEMTGIQNAMVGWHKEQPLVNFSLIVADHETVMVNQRSPVTGMAYVLKIKTWNDPDCSFTLSSNWIGAERGIADRSAAICLIESQFQTNNVNEWQIVAEHELGHALGLAHTPQSMPAIMRPQVTLDGVILPTCVDLDQLSVVREISTPCGPQ